MALPNTKIKAIWLSPDRPLTPTMIKDKFKIKGTKMVTKIKETLSSQWAAPVLLSLVLGYNVYNGQQTSAMLQHQGDEISDLKSSLIVLKTQKEEQEKIHERDRQEFKQQIEEQRIRRENLQDRLSTIEYITTGNKNGRR